MAKKKVFVSFDVDNDKVFTATTPTAGIGRTSRSCLPSVEVHGFGRFPLIWV